MRQEIHNSLELDADDELLFIVFASTVLGACMDLARGSNGLPSCLPLWINLHSMGIL
jgi:hypothetical protein